MAGPEPRSNLLGPFLHGLHELGYMEGHNVVIERRSAEGKPERLPGLAAELVRLNVAGETDVPDEEAEVTGPAPRSCGRRCRFPSCPALKRKA